MIPTMFILLSLSIIFILLVYSKIVFGLSKGKYGESRVARILKSFPQEEFLVLNDIFLKNGNRSTQIDHIVISVYGIFVIETKTYKGWIYGDCNKDYWTQNVWGNKYSIYNPIFQNEGHVKFLITKFKEIKDKQFSIFPIEVFVNCSKLEIRGNDGSVLSLQFLKEYISGFKKRLLSNEDCLKIMSAVSENNILDKKERVKHRYAVRQTIINYDARIESGLCPRCGGHLVLRKGKYGCFYGCSNFPKCRFTR